eukprot:SAG31_NODE_918_length_11020_cov_14.801392_5_plen_104_part_00
MLDAAYAQLAEALLSFNSMRHPYFYLEVTFLGIIAYLLLQKVRCPEFKAGAPTPYDFWYFWCPGFELFGTLTQAYTPKKKKQLDDEAQADVDEGQLQKLVDEW